tara:strand:+ start:308 stop:532 length:225 start_codon:yes stop_codon:yes gene_type:complete
MKVKEAIKLLQKFTNPDDEIIFAYWDKAAFGDDVNDELWSDVCDRDDKIDWGDAHEKIECHIEYMRDKDEGMTD